MLTGLCGGSKPLWLPPVRMGTGLSNVSGSVFGRGWGVMRRCRHVAAGGGAREQERFERRGAQDAAVEVSAHNEHIAGAEHGAEEPGAFAGGMALDRRRDAAAEVEQYPDDGEDAGDARLCWRLNETAQVYGALGTLVKLK